MTALFRPLPRGRTARPVTNVADLTFQLLGLAAESSQMLLGGAAELAQRAPATMRLPRQRKVCDCDCDCEPKQREPECCEIDCHAYQGERVRTPIRVTNRTSDTASFSASVSPWQGSGGDTPKNVVQLNLTDFTLSPNQSRIVVATSEIGDDFKVGSCYRADVRLVSGQREERVCLNVSVCSDDQTACEVDYRPEPQRASHCHHWCDHFYCQRPASHAHRTA
jgi:hypothetical protein